MIIGIIGLAVLGTVGYGLFLLIASGKQSAGRQALDGGDIAKSGAIAVGMYLAMLAVAVGLIDLFQAFAVGDRLAGSNNDLARGLSLLIVGTPVFVLLGVLVDRQRKTRLAAGGTAAGRGWSVHLVAALATSLIAALFSVGQLIGDFASDSRTIEAPEVAQLVGWLIIFFGYWFGLSLIHI